MGTDRMSRQKPIMETEITKLRQEVSQLRAQLSSAQLSSLDSDEPPFPQQHRRSPTETLHQQNFSPNTIITGIDNQHKRKADNTVDDPASRAREFRREMNKRQAMPPPALPQRIGQQRPNTMGGERYYEQGQDINQPQHIDTHPGGYSNQFQQSGYSPQQQRIYEGQPVSREAPTGQLAYQGNQEYQFIDLTGSAGSSMSPSNAQGGLTQQQQHNVSQSRSGFVNNINIPFKSPLRAPTPRPVNSHLVRGSGDGYFSPPNRSPSGTGAGYGNLPSPLRAGGNNFHPPVSRAEHLSPLTRQGGNMGYPYERRGGQPQPTIPNKGGGSVVSPFFTDPPTPPKNPGLPAIGGGIRRPASVAGFAGQQGGFSRSYESGLRNEGFFSRQGDVTRGITVTTEVPNWNTPISAAGGRGVGPFSGGGGGIRPGTMEGFGEGRRGDMFEPQGGGRGVLGRIFGGGIGGAAVDGVADRPGLRRSVRRD